MAISRGGRRPGPQILVALMVLAGALAAGPTAAQAPTSQPARDFPALGAAITRYYEKPVDVPQLLREWRGYGGQGWEQLMGFLAGLFAKHPGQIAIVTGSTQDYETQLVVVQGLRLAGWTEEARKAAVRWDWSSQDMERIKPVTPLLQVSADSPGTYDILWAASFASGNPAYVWPIYLSYARTASEQGIDAGDIAELALGRRKRDTIQAISAKYPPEVFKRMLSASSALWSLESNARQHSFVGAAVESYLRDAPDSKPVTTFRAYAERVRALRGQ